MTNAFRQRVSSWLWIVGIVSVSVSSHRLRGYLDGSGLSRAEVVARIGRTEAELARYEDGVAAPPGQALAAVGTVPLAITAAHRRGA